MLKISGTEKEIREFIKFNLDCPNDDFEPDYCDKYDGVNNGNCADCVLENEKRFKFVIENEKGE